MPFPVIAATCEVHGAGALTGGRFVTRTAGCHGGGEAGSVGEGGTGHPASGTGLEVAGSVVVVDGVDGCAGRRCGRVEAAADGKRGEASELAARVEPLEAARAGEPEVPATPATAATAVATSTIDATAHERFIRPDKSTVHSRDPADQALGSPAPGDAPKVDGCREEGSKCLTDP
jgi:hypothetical protein